MKLLVAAIFALAALAPALAQTDVEAKFKSLKHRGNYVFKYDRFKNITRVTSKPHTLLTRGEQFAAGFARAQSRPPDSPAAHFPTTFSMVVGFGFDGKTLSGNPQFGLYFLSDSADWLFLHDHKLYAIIDDERLELGESTRESNVYLGCVSEALSFNLTREQFEKFANGKKVEIQVGGFERTLKPERIQEFHDLLTLLGP